MFDNSDDVISTRTRTSLGAGRSGRPKLLFGKGKSIPRKVDTEYSQNEATVNRRKTQEEKKEKDAVYAYITRAKDADRQARFRARLAMQKATPGFEDLPAAQKAALNDQCNKEVNEERYREGRSGQ